MNGPRTRIEAADRQRSAARKLLRAAAVEARALYPDRHETDAPWSTNPPTPARGTYRIANDDALVVGLGALRPLDKHAGEVRRLYARPSHGRYGVARLILTELQRQAVEFRYRVRRLETGAPQHAALRV